MLLRVLDYFSNGSCASATTVVCRKGIQVILLNLYFLLKDSILTLI